MTQSIEETGAGTVPQDVVDRLATIEPGSPRARLRAARADVVRHAQGSWRAIFAPAEVATLSLVERAAIGLRAAHVDGAPSIADHFAARLTALGVAAAVIDAVRHHPTVDIGNPRLAALLLHVDRLILEPVSAEPRHLEVLRSAGLSPRDIVTASQAIGYVSFLVRAVRGLELLVSPPVEAGPRTALPAAAVRSGFTIAPLAWDAWLPTVSLDTATPAQVAVLEASHPSARTSPYYLLLVHDTEALAERSALFNAIMYGPRGLARADRELATVAASKYNGCPYCASVHAIRFAQLTKEPALVEALLDDGLEAPFDPRRRAIIDYAVHLTQSPPAATPADLGRLRGVGLDDGEILDLTHAVAMFAWANRLMQTLGEPVGPIA